ncbi:helix-turn-helix transcriptional regulator [Arthrobacter sp. ok362]|jgi:transcriptional regulator with XRE-family HTH domain|uniref:helix-turn-helix transcriptional regulator n=1 Tax=Arthrobacter sp. ok362 TaxID=1761745 RepID=UPI00088C0E01|nr:helix-turn-helix transcriptional regulator [Arthrobacter sp. ok362]SDL90840.1 Helix-turn-helix domain-containing protein [Arthrobacter sp. ok362]
MGIREEAGEFLRTRRARLTPEQLGIISGGRRRVPGLRREEVAMLAGTSSEYYARMERGDLAGVSAEVLDAVGRVLRLDEAEMQHLHDLARITGPAPVRRRALPAPSQVRPSLQAFLDAMTGAPAWVMNAQRDILATNTLGRALMAPLLDDPANGGNNARFIFLSPASRTFYPDWESAADSTVASLRTAAGRNPHDKGLTNLIGELVTRSDTFRIRWSAHNVRLHRTGVKRIVHPDVGELDFVYEGVEIPDHPGWMIFAYTASTGSPTEERLRLLGSLAAGSTPTPTPTSTRES